MTESERIAALRAALIEVAATNAWNAFGECRAFDGLRQSPGLPMSSSEAAAMARRVLAETADQPAPATPAGWASRLNVETGRGDA